MNRSITTLTCRLLSCFALVFGLNLLGLNSSALHANEKQADEKQADAKSVPVFENGAAQIVLGYKEPSDWIRHDLFVETEFDSDGDGKKDRVHVDVLGLNRLILKV